MKKSCYLCEHSVEVKYTVKLCYQYASDIVDKTLLYCIYGPPGRDVPTLQWGDMIKGEAKLEKYCRYPEVSKLAPCSLHKKTTNKKKIKSYEEVLKKEQQQKEEEKQKKQQSADMRKEVLRAKKIETERYRTARKKEKKEKLRKKKQREYQKQYRAKKREKEVYTLASEIEELEDYTRFDILGIEEENGK